MPRLQARVVEGDRQARALLLLLCLMAALAVILARDVDPYVLKPSGAMLSLPSRQPVHFLQGLLLSLAIAMPIAAKRAGPRVIRGLAVLVAGLSPVLLVFATPFTRPALHALSAVLNLAIVAALGLCLLLTRHSGPARGPAAAEGAAVTCLAVSVVLLLGEAIATGLPASHAVGYPLASRLWYEKYWKPSNRGGFRDFDRDGEPGRRIYVLGDSFVTGVGIRDVEERFSNILHRRLAPEFRVYNLGWNGSNTRDEYRRLVAQPEPPDLLILSYYTNDIQEACEESGHRMPRFKPYSNLPHLARGLVRRSYLLDLAYWRFPQADLAAYESALEECYADAGILASHLGDLERFVHYCRERRIPMLLVAFPHLVDASRSRELIAPVIRRLRSRAVPVLEVAPLLQDLSVAERIVSRNDAHPSAKLNGVVAEAALSLLRSDGLLRAARAR